MKIQKLVLTFLMPILFTISTFAGGGDVVNNGGGASEMTVVYTHQNYGSLVEICTRTLSCGLAADETSLLLTMITHLPQEQAVNLAFKSGLDMGTQLFSTGKEVGSKVEINKDQLWKIDLFGRTHSYSLADALELLTLAWGWHHPQFAEKVKISLAKKLATHALAGKAAYLPYLLSSNLRFLMVKEELIDQLYLEDGYDSFLNLHQLVLQQLPCQAVEFSAYGFQWSPIQLQEDDGTRILLNGRIGWKCDDPEASHYTASLGIHIKVKPISEQADSSTDAQKGSLKMVNQTVELDLSNIKKAL
ncbi:MAG: hypothetical protein ACXWC9_01405 [Pseudobdellovibrionaceae bacterium]